MIHDFIMHVICPFAGTVGYAVLFNIPRRFYLCCGITGTAGWLLYHAVVSMDASAATASFFGTMAVVLTSRVMSVRKKCPITIFLVAGILPLVPGAGIYYTVYYMVTNQLAEAVQRGMDSVKVAFAIVLGIVLVLSIPGGVFQMASVDSRRKSPKE
ncbi:MAG: threonine/serine exporter family protein [Lachnospiraceae bacterium]